MYSIIENIIDHEWVSNYSGDQSYIYYICGLVIVIFFVWFLDVLKEIIRIARGSK